MRVSSSSLTASSAASAYTMKKLRWEETSYIVNSQPPYIESRAMWPPRLCRLAEMSCELCQAGVPQTLLLTVMWRDTDERQFDQLKNITLPQPSLILLFHVLEEVL